MDRNKMLEELEARFKTPVRDVFGESFHELGCSYGYADGDSDFYKDCDCSEKFRHEADTLELASKCTAQCITSIKSMMGLK
jgi:hypothetical protein